jgi:transcriptional regulator with XRE-family HTH domain
MGSELGEKLRAAREKRGWGLREVERRTGIHNAHLSQIEKGVIERPDPNILWTLASAYGNDFKELMRLAGHVHPGKDSALVGTALRALGDLTPAEQRDVLDYMAKVKSRRMKSADTT